MNLEEIARHIGAPSYGMLSLKSSGKLHPGSLECFHIHIDHIQFEKGVCSISFKNLAFYIFRIFIL